MMIFAPRKLLLLRLLLYLANQFAKTFMNDRPRVPDVGRSFRLLHRIVVALLLLGGDGARTA